MFALLEHTTGVEVHWDLLVEAPGQERLATWRLRADPIEARGELAVEPLEPHRIEYLDYEGALSGGRGFVRRLDRGPADVQLYTPQRTVVVLGGKHLRGRYEIQAGTGAAGVMRRVDQPHGSKDPKS